MRVFEDDITLAAAGDSVSATFSVCDDEGRAIWYGPFLDADTDHPRGDAQAATMAAAGRAIGLAARARTDAGLPAATLRLTLSEPVDDEVTLACTAAMGGLALIIEVAQDNPALDWCYAFGRLHWTPRVRPRSTGSQVNKRREGKSRRAW
ncbi:hypothetical protein [Nocardia camponoti]|uniref:Uncharacterized protein n=1 Tax=Nocardia camponoti TaxID=1616106 RepID=A0A917QD99_9NOCA|nr:hypothetical protein [Nocardia camponoti]GGK45628.1 hypothetical protein GCM10011591_16420 [Nocardia camponoti]